MISYVSYYIISTQGGSGYAKDIKFINIAMQNVTNPIIIDQNYCDQKKACHEQVIAFKCLEFFIF